jgi:IS1 family transposase
MVEKLYVAYEQESEGLEFWGFFESDEEASQELIKRIEKSIAINSVWKIFAVVNKGEGITRSPQLRKIEEYN